MVSILSAKDELEEHLLNISLTICQQVFPLNLIKCSLQIVMDWATSTEITDSDKILVAELIYKNNADFVLVNSWLEGVKQSDLYKSNLGSQWKNLSPFIDRIRLNRLKSALGCEQDLITAVPRVSDPKHDGTVLFERHLVRFANIWGNAWAKESVSADDIVRAIKPVFGLFLKNHDETNDWTGWYELRAAAVDFYSFAIRATSEHGIEHIFTLSEAFRAHWKKHHWPTDWRRKIALAIYKEGGTKDELIQTLNELEEQIVGFDDVYSNVADFSDLAITWAKVGEHGKAKNLLPKIIKGSFGIYHDKDRQFSHWVSWLGKMVHHQPEIIQDDIRYFSAALVNLELSNRGRGTQEAARDLISIVTLWDIEYAFKLVNWLFEKKGLHYNSGITGLLQGMLNRKNPPCQEITLFTNNLLIPFEEYNPSKLPELLIYSCYQFLSQQNAEEQVSSIANSISTNLLPSIRYSWWKGIASGLKKADQNSSEYTIKAMALHSDKYGDDKTKLILSNNEKLTDEQAQLRVNSIASLIDLIKQVESSGYFQWLELIEPYLADINSLQLTELYELINEFSPQHNAVAAIADRFIQLGNIEKANTILTDLLESSDSKGWDLNWDGGSRQAAFKTLILIDSKRWRPIALCRLVGSM